MTLFLIMIIVPSWFNLSPCLFFVA